MTNQSKIPLVVKIVCGSVLIFVLIIFFFITKDQLNEPFQLIELPKRYNTSELAHYSEGLCAVRTRQQYGYIDVRGQEVIPCIYSVANPFFNHRALVGDEKGMYLIDPTGNKIIQLPGQRGNSNKDYLFLEKNQLWALFDYEGNQLTDFIFNQVWSQYTYPVLYKKSKNNSKEFFIYKDNRLLSINDGNEYLHVTADNFIIGILKNGKSKVYNLEGEEIKNWENVVVQVIGPNQFSTNDNKMYLFVDGNYKFNYHNRVGLRSKEGKTILSPQYDHFIPLNESENFVVRKDNKWGLINREELYLIPLTYEIMVPGKKNQFYGNLRQVHLF